MNNTQHHRGPDDGGYYRDQRDVVALAMRRLSIVDIVDGHQPMASSDEQIWIVFNGEIVNAPELRKQLEDEGCRFRTSHSDTEVLIQLYVKYQEGMLSLLNGMFAFVIHDKRRGRLFGARDHFGIKPLYYAFDGTRFAFASELKSLRVLPWICRDIDPQALYHYLSFQCVPSPLSIYAAVSKLPAAHSFVLDLGRKDLRIQKYWQPPTGWESGAEPAAGAQLAEIVRKDLEHAVRRWTLSDVPVACSLSGGVDSAAIVGLMANQSDTPIQTYTLGFEDAPDLDERRLARIVANRWGTEHHEIVLRCDDLLADLDDMARSLDEPYAGGLPSWFVFKGMAGETKVCMTGTGGDELFGNYGKWRVYESWWQGLRQVACLAQKRGWLRDFIRYPRGSRYPIYFRDADKRAHLLDKSRRPQPIASEELIEKIWHDGQPATVRDAVRLVDLRIQLPDEFLHMTDRFSMAHSIEARPPFLDRLLAEKLMSIPATRRIGNARLKQVLIEGVADLLPRELIEAPKKGFVLPVSAWLRGRLRSRVEHLLGRDYLRKQNIFEEAVHDRLVRPHLDGRQDHAWQLWTLLMFQIWYAQEVGE